MSVYTVEEHSFPGTLAGLDEAVEVAAALASAHPVQIFKDGRPLDYIVPVQPRKPVREGWHEWKSGS